MEEYDYLIRRKVFTLAGASFHIYDAQNILIGFSHQKAFKLKEDIRIYEDESKTKEVILIKARQIIDFSANYDVYDSQTGDLIGTWRRKGFSSIVRDKWLLFSAMGMQIGELQEDSLILALIRRGITGLIPQSYQLNYLNNGCVATYSQSMNPFVFKIRIKIMPGNTLHPDLILAGGILLSAIERRQN